MAPIAIVGGGPAGLCLGALLAKQNVPFTIYELREEPQDASLHIPSGMLDLHEESGLAALKACGLLDQFATHASECAEDTVVTDHTGEIMHFDEGHEGTRPEIARNSLVHLLRSGLPKDSILWNHKLRTVQKLDSGLVALDFGDNGVHEHEFVVGADGAWSQVRSLVSDVKPHYGGINYAILRINNASTKYPELTQFVGKGSAMILGKHNGLMTHRGVNGSIITYACVKNDSETAIAEKTGNLTPQQFQDAMFADDKLFGQFTGHPRTLLSTASQEEAEFSGDVAPPLKPLYMLPIGNSWTNVPGVTAIGDAAHLMMPWAGEGVNLAMADALSLSQAIVQAVGEKGRLQENLTPRVVQFEKEMFERSKEAAQETWNNCGILFGEDGGRAFGELMKSYGPPSE